MHAEEMLVHVLDLRRDVLRTHIHKSFSILFMLNVQIVTFLGKSSSKQLRPLGSQSKKILKIFKIDLQDLHELSNVQE